MVFAPIAIIITSVTIFQMWKILGPNKKQNLESYKTTKLSIRIIDLMTLIGFIGILSIWPAKISVFYAFFLVIAIYAFNRLECRFNKMK